MVPLVSLLATAIQKGSGRFDLAFFTESLRNVVGDGGGAVHAIIGTLVITGLRDVHGGSDRDPDGGLRHRVRHPPPASQLATRFIVDVMTGIPSIVAGLFIFSFWGARARAGLLRRVSGRASRCSILMLPTVVRSSRR